MHRNLSDQARSLDVRRLTVAQDSSLLLELQRCEAAPAAWHLGLAVACAPAALVRNAPTTERRRG
jgi:hypothetical protein